MPFWLGLIGYFPWTDDTARYYKVLVLLLRISPFKTTATGLWILTVFILLYDVASTPATWIIELLLRLIVMPLLFEMLLFLVTAYSIQHKHPKQKSSNSQKLQLRRQRKQDAEIIRKSTRWKRSLERLRRKKRRRRRTEGWMSYSKPFAWREKIHLGSVLADIFADCCDWNEDYFDIMFCSHVIEPS